MSEKKKRRKFTNATQFKKGHIPWSKGRKGWYAKGCEKGWFKVKPDREVSYWYAHTKARKIFTGEKICILKEIGGCTNKIEIHHIDADAWNNSLDNLVSLCNRHHKLVEMNYIDLKNPKTPDRHVYPNGRVIYSSNKQFLKLKVKRNRLFNDRHSQMRQSNTEGTP